MRAGDDAITGVVMDHKQWRVDERGGKTHASSEPLSFAIAASSPDSDTHITVRSSWTTNSDGAEVWKVRHTRTGLAAPLILSRS